MFDDDVCQVGILGLPLPTGVTTRRLSGRVGRLPRFVGSLPAR